MARPPSSPRRTVLRHLCRQRRYHYRSGCRERLKREARRARVWRSAEATGYYGGRVNSLTDLPLPPPEFRRLVGPTDPKFFDNSGPQLVFSDVNEDAYSSVFDFGCGCGRLARQLIQQRPRPGRYLGVDRHKGMISWCHENLAPRAPGFEFQHHNVFHEMLNPQGTPGHLPLPAADKEATLFIAWSVFTHLLEPDAEFYMQELARVLGQTGVAVTTWFLFDKGDFPMMQEFQNALFINDRDPTNAVIFDRDWLSRQVSGADLVMTRIIPPSIRGFQWTIHLERRQEGRVPAAFPEDVAPRGIARPPIG
jgi:SAM-dependent methyltransferase